MTTFYTIDSEGNIEASASVRFSVDCLETEQEIVRGWDGRLYFAGEEPPLDPAIAIKAAISDIEVTITPRRFREAVLGTDGGWLASKEKEIQTLRELL